MSGKHWVNKRAYTAFSRLVVASRVQQPQEFDFRRRKSRPVTTTNLPQSHSHSHAGRPFFKCLLCTKSLPNFCPVKSIIWFMRASLYVEKGAL